MANHDRDDKENFMEHKIFQHSKPKTNRTRRQKPSTLPFTTTTTNSPSTQIQSRIDSGMTGFYPATTTSSSEDLPSLPKTISKTSTKIPPHKADLKVEPMNGLNDSSPTFKQASLFPVKHNSSSFQSFSVHCSLLLGLLHLIILYSW